MPGSASWEWLLQHQRGNKGHVHPQREETQRGREKEGEREKEEGKRKWKEGGMEKSCWVVNPKVTTSEQT